MGWAPAFSNLLDFDFLHPRLWNFYHEIGFDQVFYGLPLGALVGFVVQMRVEHLDGL